MKKGDFLVIALILVISLCALLPFVVKKGDSVRVIQSGTVIYEGSLAQDTQIRLEGNTVTVKDGKAWVSEADCPDGLCKRGECTPTHPLICLPNELVVSIVSQGEVPDGISH